MGLRMNKGWIRAWIVASVLSVVVAFVGYYPTEENQRTWFSSGVMRSEIQTWDDERAVLDNYFSRSYLPKGARECASYGYLRPLHPDSENSLMVVDCPRSTFERIVGPLFIAGIYSAVFLIVGFVVAWVRSGFRQSKSEA